MDPFSIASGGPMSLAGGLHGGAGGSAGPSSARLETGGFQGMFGLDASGWTVATSGSTARGGSSGGAGGGVAIPWMALAVVAALGMGVMLWKR